MKTIVRPLFFRGWSALDVGFVDKTGWLAGYVDFMEATIVVEDEFLLPRATTRDIAETIEARERALWGKDRGLGGYSQPYVRVSDVDHRLIADLREQHGLDFEAIKGKNVDADVNLVNVLISGKQLLVSAKCEHLRRQLREGVWNKTKKDMAKDAQGGHFDLLAALRYGVRHAYDLLKINPFPPGYRAAMVAPGASVSIDGRTNTPAPLSLSSDTAFSRAHSAQPGASGAGWWTRRG